MRKSLFFTMVFMIVHTFSVFAQNTGFKEVFLEAKEKSAEVLVTLKDNNTITGKVLSVTDEFVEIDAKDGNFKLKLDRIKSVNIIDPSDLTTQWYKNPAANKLFLLPSGRMDEPGVRTYQNTLIFLSTFGYSVSKYVNFSGTFSTIPWTSISDQFYILSAKVGTNLNESFSFAGNLSYYYFAGDYSAGTFFGSGTYTKNRLDLTGGFGVAFADKASSDLVFTLGGQFRVVEKFAVVAENFVIPDSGNNEYEPLTILGGRYIGRTVATDVGFLVGPGLGGNIPFVSFIIKF